MATLEITATTSKEKMYEHGQVVNVVEIGIHKLPHMESLYKQVKDEVNKLQYARQVLVNDISALELNINIR